MSTFRETLLSTVQKWTEAHKTQEMTIVATLRTPDCQYPRLPSSLNLPVMNNQEWDIFFPTTRSLFAKDALRNLDVIDTFVDEECRKAILMTRERSVSESGVKFENETIFKHMAFVDSLAMMEFLRANGVTDSALEEK